MQSHDSSTCVTRVFFLLYGTFSFWIHLCMSFCDGYGWGRAQHWRATHEEQDSIVSRPELVYRERGWSSWAEWLGASRDRPAFWSFQVARQWVRRQPGCRRLAALVTSDAKAAFEDWRGWVQAGHCPSEVPSEPQRTYRSEWVSWEDWLKVSALYSLCAWNM
jgi:hypothetical protein